MKEKISRTICACVIFGFAGLCGGTMTAALEIGFGVGPTSYFAGSTFGALCMVKFADWIVKDKK